MPFHTCPRTHRGPTIGRHSDEMIAVTGAIAILVYEWVGLAILRSAWINLDTIWAGALVAAGVISLAI